MNDQTPQRPNPYEVVGPTVSFGSPAAASTPHAAAPTPDHNWRPADPVPEGYQLGQDYTPTAQIPHSTETPAGLPPTAQTDMAQTDTVHLQSAEGAPYYSAMPGVPTPQAQGSRGLSGGVIAALIIGAIVLFGSGIGIGYVAGTTSSIVSAYENLPQLNTDTGIDYPPPYVDDTAWPMLGETVGDMVEDGLYFIGLDLTPGTYTAPGGDACYWDLTDGTSFADDDIVEYGQGDGPHTVTVPDNDGMFYSEECGPWTRVS